MSEPQATTAEQIAAELDALHALGIESLRKQVCHGVTYWHLNIGDFDEVGVCLKLRNERRNETMIVGWVMAECEREGLWWECFPGGFRISNGEPPYAEQYRMLAEMHERSLALSALCAYRAAREAEVQHG